MPIVKLDVCAQRIVFLNQKGKPAKHDEQVAFEC